ncbi:MAG: hypothetical protein ACI9TK_000705 [Flavobacteriaceae bacterium]
MGMLFKFLLLFLGGIYFLRLISPFLFKLLISNFLKKEKKQRYTPKKEANSTAKQTKSSSNTMGEYIDYEDVE